MVSAVHSASAAAKMRLDERRESLFREAGQLRSELENIKDAHRLVKKEIKGIRRAMGLLVVSCRSQNNGERSRESHNLQSNCNQMIRLPTEFSQNIDMEAMCTDIPMLEPLSDDDMIFGEYDEYDSPPPDETFRHMYLQRRQSYQFGSPSPERAVFNAKRVSPTRASIHFDRDFRVSPSAAGTVHGRRSKLATMREDDHDDSSYMSSETDVETDYAGTESSESQDLSPRSFVHHMDGTYAHLNHGQVPHSKRRGSAGMIDAESLRWSSSYDTDTRQFALESIAEYRVSLSRKHPPVLRRGSTQPNLYAYSRQTTSMKGAANSTKRHHTAPPSPADSSRRFSFQIPATSSRHASTSPKSSPRQTRSASVYAQQELIGSPLTMRRGSAAAAAAAAFTSRNYHLERRVTEIV
ncbi:uncharacterized protein [Diadema antillarum]|uniref:uncharacterized protein n=1 Tax=Diadema antillarum TaxID=105358 RepID=UPI003A869752